MKATIYRASFVLLLGFAALPMMWGQAPGGDSAPPLLTLDDAVRIAAGNNRDVRISELNVVKSTESVAQAKTNYLPKLDSYALAGAPLQQLNFTVPAGTFGTYPGVGRIPAKNSNIQSPQQFGAFVYASAAQPLTQLYKVKLAVREARLGIDLAHESVRGQQQETRRQVKEAYYQVAQTQAQVESAKAAVQALTELSGLTERRLTEQTVLASDSLTVKAKLKQQRYQLLTLQDAFELQKQGLNRLLGRDLRTQFTVEMQPLSEIAELDLEIARKQALKQRPEVREARLQWQPFDWGYKKHKIRELTATSRQKALTEQDAEQQVLLDVEDTFRKLTQARVLLDAQTDARAAEQAKLKEVTDRYSQKSALLSDLLQQQAAVSQADALYQQALAGFWTSRAEFEKAIGAN